MCLLRPRYVLIVLHPSGPPLHAIPSAQLHVLVHLLPHFIGYVYEGSSLGTQCRTSSQAYEVTDGERATTQHLHDEGEEFRVYRVGEALVAYASQ